MSLEEAFEALRDVNERMWALAQEGNLHRENIESFAAEYKTILEKLNAIQLKFFQAVMIENVTAQCRNAFFDSMHNIGKDALKQ